MQKTYFNARTLLPLYLSIAVVIGILLGYRLKPAVFSSENSHAISGKQQKLSQVYQYVVNEYVDSVSPDKVTEEGINGILSSLDPHSSYIPAALFHQVNDPLMGEFEGIGIQFRIVQDSVVIIQVIKGGPSEKVGILAGDRIVLVNDSTLFGTEISNEKVIRNLKGPEGTQVKVSVYRRGVKELLDFNITRGVIPTHSIDLAYTPEPGIGYIKMSTFSSTSYQEIHEALTQFNHENINSLILDLRGNGGGRMQAAIDIADEFLKENQMIVYTHGYHRKKKEHYATSKGIWLDKELIILLDEGAASSSEIVAGAIQDNDRGLIIGRRSFGKGLVQEQLHFPDGSALRLTIARYYTPTGRSIQKPYDPDEGFEEYYVESYHRTIDTLNQTDSIKKDTLRYTTPAGKIVYGGGGIWPDIDIEAPVDKYPFYYALLNKGLMFQYAFEYTDKNRLELGEYQSVDRFIELFSFNETMYSAFIAFAKEKTGGLGFSKQDMDDSSTRIQNLIKAYIAQNLFDNNGFYPIYHQQDEVFQQALNTLKQ